MSAPEGPKRGRGRPPGTGIVDPEDLLDRAMRAIGRGGYRALSMRGLARELGVSLASVQHRFPTKDALWRAAVDRAVAVGDPAAISSESLAVMLQHRIGAGASYPGLILELLADDAPGHEDRIRYVIDRLAPSFEAARLNLRTAAAEGRARDIDIDAFIAMMVGIGVVGALPPQIRAALDLGEDSAERLAAGIADVLLFGVVARDEPTRLETKT